MKQPRSPRDLPHVSGGPEELFRLGDIVDDQATVRGSMRTGPWLAGTAGLPSPGSIGVLADDVLGYSIIRGLGGDDGWSVSTEICVDFCGPVPLDGSTLSAQAWLLQADSRGGLASGQVLDGSGQVVALCRQRGRFVAYTPADPVASLDGPRAAAAQTVSDTVPAIADTATLIGADVAAVPGGAILNLSVTPRVSNTLANLHGGISLSASEMAATVAFAQQGPPVVAGSIHIAYVRAIPVGAQVTFEATVHHRGRTFAVATVVGTTAAGRLCTIATVTAHAPE